MIYSALLTSTKKEVFKEIMTSMIDPSIRYAAYQSQIPRSLAIPTIASRSFPRSDQELADAILKIDPSSLGDQSPAAAREEGTTDNAEAVPQTIMWRSRTVHIEHASIAAALGSVAAASERLSETLSASSARDMSAKDRATAYDDLLIACQDTVDATRDAIGELSGEGVNQTDRRMQALQITRTAVMYELLSWRIGRNRVLTGEDDGMNLEGTDEVQGVPKTAKHNPKDNLKEEGKPRNVARLTERIVLYGSTLQVWRSPKACPDYVRALTQCLYRVSNLSVSFPVWLPTSLFSKSLMIKRPTLRHLSKAFIRQSLPLLRPSC
jgi:signal recognition particle subunit SRP68